MGEASSEPTDALEAVGSPQLFFQEDVGLGGGIALTDIDFREQRRREFLGAFLTYTTEGQERYRLVWRRWLYHREIPEGGVAVEERSFLGAAGGYQRTLTRRFFGLGPDTRESDESSFTDEVTDLGTRLDLALPGPGGDWIASAGLRGEHHNLARGRVEDVPSTDDAFPAFFDDADGRSAGWVTLGLRYDTRDSQHQPYSGWRVGVLVDAFLVRMTLTPAVMHLLGDAAWWIPRWLDRLLPDLDVEGVKLSERLAAEDAEAQTRDEREPVPAGV